MAQDLAKLVVKLEAQTAQYQAGLERANKKMAGFQRKQKQALDKVGGYFKGLAVTLGAGLFIKATADSIRRPRGGLKWSSGPDGENH